MANGPASTFTQQAAPVDSALLAITGPFSDTVVPHTTRDQRILDARQVFDPPSTTYVDLLLRTTFDQRRLTGSDSSVALQAVLRDQDDNDRATDEVFRADFAHATAVQSRVAVAVGRLARRSS